MTRFASLALLLAAAACAKAPSSIAPAYVGETYASTPCSAVTAALNAERKEQDRLEDKQRAAVAADAATVFLVLIPVSAFAGDSSADLATSKGKVLALEARARQCGVL